MLECLLIYSKCFLISVDHALILVFSASIMLECLLISVDHALILVFSASIQADCLIVSDRVAQIPPPSFYNWLFQVINSFDGSDRLYFHSS